MILYIKGNFKKKITFGYEELAHKMWFKERNGQEISLSHSGNDEMLQEDCYIWLSLNKWVNDSRWNSAEIVALRSFLTSETIGMEFEDAFISDYRERGEYLRITSTHKDILTVDKRAMYIMAIEIATALDGQISEDYKLSWLTIEEFKERHIEVLSLTFEEAYELALKEIFEINVVRDPFWNIQDKQKEEYIQIHGERIYPEDEEYYYGDSDDEDGTGQ